MCSTQYVGQQTFTKYHCGVQLFVQIYPGAYPDVRVFVGPDDRTSPPKARPPVGGSGSCSDKFLKNKNYEINCFKENCWI